MMLLECLKEFSKYIIFRLFARPDIGMSTSIVDTLDVIDVKDPTAILVDLLESSFDDLLSEFVHGASDASDEFIIVDVSIAISIKCGEHLLDFIVSQFNSEVLNGFLEFSHVEEP